MGRWTGVGTMLVPRGSWVLALWSHFGNVWIYSANFCYQLHSTCLFLSYEVETFCFILSLESETNLHINC